VTERFAALCLGQILGEQTILLRAVGEALLVAPLPNPTTAPTEATMSSPSAKQQEGTLGWVLGEAGLSKFEAAFDEEELTVPVLASGRFLVRFLGGFS
jgi:hypothetical protein